MRNKILSIALLSAAVLRGQQTVDAVKVIARPTERKLELPGEFQPYEQAAIHAKVSGFVKTVAVDRGSHVSEGQELAVLTAPELDARIAEAQARVSAMQAQVAEAQAHASAAQATYEKLRAASETPGAIAGNELLQAGQQVEAEKARVRAAQSSVTAAAANVKAVEDTRAYLRVTAPFSGVITTRYVHPGALVGAQTGPLFDLERQNRLRLVVAVPERDAGGIPRGGRVTFKVPAYPGVVFSGNIARRAGKIDPDTRTMPVEIDVANQRSRLAPGMYTTVSWTVESHGVPLLAPPTAVVTTTERTFVNRIRDGRIEWVDVVKGARSGELVEVRGPLSAGDVIARRGSDELRSGMRVQAKLN